MEDKTKTIRALALAAMILYALRTAMQVGLRLFPQIAFSVYGTPLDLDKAIPAVRHPLMFIEPALCFGIFLTLYLLLRAQIAAPTAFSGPLLGLILGGSLLIAVFSWLWGAALQLLIVRFQGIEAMSANAILSNALNIVSLPTAVAFPLLSAAAGMNWYRHSA